VRRLFLCLGLAAALLGTACAAAAAPASSAESPSQEQTASGERRSDAGSVTIVVGWLTDAVPSARVVMDTHSVDLDGFDLAPLTRARVDGGAWLAASQWDAPKGGHHRSGTLRFAALDRERLDSARTIEVEIRDIATPVRLLRWERPT